MKEIQQLSTDLLSRARQLTQAGRLEAATEKYQQILALGADNPVVHFELGIIAFKQEQHQSAISELRKAIELDPNQATFHNALGIVYSNADDLTAGARCFARALELNPDNAATYNNLGSNYKDQGQLTDAADCYRKAIAANPRYTEAYVNLARLLKQQGDLLGAADTYKLALSLNSEHAEIPFELAATLHQIGHHQEAVALFRIIADREPEYPGVYNNLGLTLASLGNYTQAVSCYRKAIDIDPDSAAPFVSLGNLFMVQGDLDGALANFRQALALRPEHAMAHSNVLLILNYFADKSQAELYQEALQFDAQQARRVAQEKPSFQNSRDKDRVLRIGYVSPDFKTHSVIHFTRQLIGAHNRDQVEVFCYANVQRTDEITREFITQADHWLSIRHMDDGDVAERIRYDQIDILIDLAGHTANNNLLAFARRAAPVQVNWLGYPNTTGLSEMDYRLTDAIADPPDIDNHGDDQYYAEKLIRLPQGFLCYQVDGSPPPVAACPFHEQGHITFGSFNNLPKITPDVIRIWSQVLNRTADSRLILKSNAFIDETIRARYLQAFLAHGISPQRIDLLGYIPGREQHLTAYSGIDITLDTFPYNGTTTTCEALWMGVPVISLRCDCHAGRVGTSILHHVGLSAWVADSEKEYIEQAHALANDRQQLIRRRETLRSQMRESALMDIHGFTQSLENAFRDMWRTWCDSP